jgi:hypothetical protein
MSWVLRGHRQTTCLQVKSQLKWVTCVNRSVYLIAKAAAVVAPRMTDVLAQRAMRNYRKMPLCEENTPQVWINKEKDCGEENGKGKDEPLEKFWADPQFLPRRGTVVTGRW